MPPTSQSCGLAHWRRPSLSNVEIQILFLTFDSYTGGDPSAVRRKYYSVGYFTVSRTLVLFIRKLTDALAC